MSFRRVTRAQFSWMLYDWANSVFATTVMAGFFPVFFKEYWSSGIEPTRSTAYLGFANSAASAAIAMLLPFLGAYSDICGTKKKLIFVFTGIGCLATYLLGTLEKGEFTQAALAYAIGAFAFNGACALYDSLLASVGSEGESDRLSSAGYAFGYLGGGILFLLNVLMYQHPNWFALESGVQAIRYSFYSAAIWWLVFSLPLFLFVEEKPTQGGRIGLLKAVKSSFAELIQTCRQSYSDRNMWFFLLAYWLYIDGVYSVVKMAVDYGVALGFQASQLISALLLTQFVGFPAALLYARIGERVGIKQAILFGLMGYFFIIAWATQMSHSWEFYVLATLIGCVQGGVQALSRSFYLKLIPAERVGEYFGFLNLVGKFGSILGPALVGFVAYETESSRFGIGSLSLLFALGAYFFMRIEEHQEA